MVAVNSRESLISMGDPACPSVGCRKKTTSRNSTRETLVLLGKIKELGWRSSKHPDGKGSVRRRRIDRHDHFWPESRDLKTLS